jgi:uncharacterized membrane protein
MTRKAMLGLALALAIIGAILVIYGAFYTARSNDYVVTYYGYTIWSPPGFPSDATISANYALNYVGIALILLGIVIAVRNHTSPSSVPRPTANSETNPLTTQRAEIA